MKIRPVLLIPAILWTIAAFGCSYSPKTPEVIETPSDSETDDPETNNAPIVVDKIDIQFSDHEEEFLNEDGVLMLSVSGNYPVVTIGNNAKASSAINQYYESETSFFDQTAKQYRSYAESYYATESPETLEYWSGYGLDRSFSIARSDSKNISLIEDQYEYTGGAHPNSFKTAQTFETATGDLLSLSDICLDLNSFRSFANDYITTQTKSAEYSDMLFESYESSIPDILSDDTWYFSSEGMVVISNPYIISPYAAGILEFTIPYAECEGLKEEYIPE